MAESIVRANAQKNRIYIDMDGFLTLDEAKKLRDDYASAIALCRPGFTVLTNAIKYKPSKEDVQEIHSEMAKMDEDAGCSKVARVVGDKPLGGMQITRLVKEHAAYPTKHFQTIEEAEAYLDSDEP